MELSRFSRARRGRPGGHQDSRSDGWDGCRWMPRGQARGLGDHPRALHPHHAAGTAQPASPSAGHTTPADTGQLHAQLCFGKRRQGCTFFPSVLVPNPHRAPHPSRQRGVPAKGWLSVSPAVFPLRGWEAETCCNTPDEAAPGAFPDGNLAAAPVLGPHPAWTCKAPRPGEEHACVRVLPAPAQSPLHVPPLPGTGGGLTFHAGCCEGKLRHG